MENTTVNVNSSVVLFGNDGEIKVLDDINISMKRYAISNELPYYSPELKNNLL